MLNVLGIVIGLIFVLLLFSLLASTVMEVIAAILSLRSRHLRHTLENMLAEKAADFVRHPFFKQLSYATSKRARISPYSMPSYLSKDTFTAIVGDLMEAKNGQTLVDRISNLDEGDLKRMMQYMYRRADGNPLVFTKEVEHWFDEVMARASDWYRRNLTWWLFAVGLVLAAIFNADTIQIYKNISASATTQDFLVEMAANFSAKTDTIAGPNMDLSLEESIARLDADLQNIEHIKSPLGLGWNSAETGKNVPWWAIKLIGLLLTGIAVTFGAPFWFDLLKKLLSLHNGNSEKLTEARVNVTPTQPGGGITTTLERSSHEKVVVNESPQDLVIPETDIKRPVG